MNYSYLGDIIKTSHDFNAKYFMGTNDNSLGSHLMYILDFFAWILYGYGKRPLYPLGWSIIIIFYFAIIWMICGLNRNGTKLIVSTPCWWIEFRIWWRRNHWIKTLIIIAIPLVYVIYLMLRLLFPYIVILLIVTPFLVTFLAVFISIAIIAPIAIIAIKAEMPFHRRIWNIIRTLFKIMVFSTTVFLSGARFFVEPPKLPGSQWWVNPLFTLERVLGAFFFILFFLAIGATVVR